MDATIPSERPQKGLRYGRNHPIKRVMYKSIHATWTCVIWVQGLESQPDHCTISNMRIDVLKSSTLENHLGTGQWCELLASARDTTSNVNGSQGTASAIHKVWRMIWSRTLVKSPNRRPMMKACRRARRTFHWGMQAPRYQKGFSRSTSRIMSWSRQEATNQRRSIVFPTSSMQDKGTRWLWMRQRI